MDKANVSIRKYFSKQTITGISSHIRKAKKLIFRHHKFRKLQCQRDDESTFIHMETFVYDFLYIPERP